MDAMLEISIGCIAIFILYIVVLLCVNRSKPNAGLDITFFFVGITGIVLFSVVKITLYLAP